MKELEKQRKIQEELEEEERVRRERELMKIEAEREEEKKKKNLENLMMENRKLMDNHVVMKKGQKRVQIDFPQQNEPADRQNQNNNNYNNNEPPRETQSPHTYNLAMHEEELKRNVNNEILKLRNHLVDQQNSLLNQINELKIETQNANMQRYEALKEISTLKEELSKQRIDEELRRKYVYDVLVDNTSKINYAYNKTNLPDIKEDEFKPEYPTDHMANLKKMNYEETVKYPNRIPRMPDLSNTGDNHIKASSRFIDINTHNVVDVIKQFILFRV